MSPVLFAFLLTLLAGLATGVGSLIALLARRTNTAFLAISLGFSAGVMLYVSMVELLGDARVRLMAALGPRAGGWAAVGAFFGGMLLIGIIDKLLPEEKNPHNMQNAAITEEKSAAASAAVDREKETVAVAVGAGGDVASAPAATGESEARLMRMGLFTALAIAIHNFPEGIATFMAGLAEPSVAIPVAVAIAIHNIPEGIAVSVPIFYATGDRKKAFVYSFLSGLSEPLGALVGYALLSRFLNATVMGLVFAGVAGIMVFISLDELLPSAREYGEQHLSIYGMVAGMAVMAVSLLIL